MDLMLIQVLIVRNVELMVENLFKYRYTIKTIRYRDALCKFEFEEMLALCLILTLFFPI